jgi:hypothetical protein
MTHRPYTTFSVLCDSLLPDGERCPTVIAEQAECQRLADAVSSTFGWYIAWDRHVCPACIVGDPWSRAGAGVRVCEGGTP